jgi:protein SCO1/2
MKTRQRFFITLFVLACGAAGAGLAFLITDRPGARPDTEAVLLETPRQLPAISLQSHQGNAWTPGDLQDDWSLVFFGFTNCPDVCPESMTVINQAVERIGSRENTPVPSVYFVSVDPARDTPQRLAEYVPYFNPAFTGLTGEPAAIQSLAASMAVPVPPDMPTTPPSEEYDVSHGASISLVGPSGNVRAFFTPPHDPDRMADDFVAIHRYLTR